MLNYHCWSHSFHYNVLVRGRDSNWTSPCPVQNFYLKIEFFSELFCHNEWMKPLARPEIVNYFLFLPRWLCSTRWIQLTYKIKIGRSLVTGPGPGINISLMISVHWVIPSDDQSDISPFVWKNEDVALITMKILSHFYPSRMLMWNDVSAQTEHYTEPFMNWVFSFLN